MSFLNKNNNQNYSAYVEFMLYISSSSLSALLLLLEPPIDLDPSCSCFFAVCLLHPQQQERGKSSIIEEESIHTVIQHHGIEKYLRFEICKAFILRFGYNDVILDR